MGLLRSASGLVEDLESRRDNRIGEVAEFISHLREISEEANDMIQEVEQARERLDDIEEDAKSVQEFVDQLPSFNGGDN